MKRKNFGSRTWLYPMPVLIVAAYDDKGNPNAMNAAWGGIHTDNQIGICLSETHRTTQNILLSKAFTISIGTLGQKNACDYVGLVSGNNVADKFARAGFHASKSEKVNAPLIEEFPMALECELISYDTESNYMVGKIVNIAVSENILDQKGNIDPDRLRPLIYDPCRMEYRVLGEKVGKAFSDGKNL